MGMFGMTMHNYIVNCIRSFSRLLAKREKPGTTQALDNKHGSKHCHALAQRQASPVLTYFRTYMHLSYIF
jgi:hypothetical protein